MEKTLDMSDDIRNLHHVGLVVHDMEDALAVYRRLGFALEPPSYPALPQDSGDLEPFGAGNTHAYLRRNFVELVTVVTDGVRIPGDANLVPLQVPADHLAKVTEVINETVDRFVSCLARFEGLHRLVFATPDIDAIADRLTSAHVDHSGVNTTQRPVDTDDGPRIETVRHLEISSGPAGAEAILAVAETESLHDLRPVDHPNGALDLVDTILCVADYELASVERRYETYLARTARESGSARVFQLDDSRLTLVAASDLEALLPGEHPPDLGGEHPPALAALVAYAVSVGDLAATEQLLRTNGFAPTTSPSGHLVVPSAAALGAAVIFQQVEG